MKDGLSHISEIMDLCIQDLAAKNSIEKFVQAATACGFNGGRNRVFMLDSFASTRRKRHLILLTKKKSSPTYSTKKTKPVQLRIVVGGS